MKQGSNAEHAKYFSPSSAKAWKQCPAFAIIKAHGKVIKVKPHVNTSMGTMTHGAAEAMLRGEIENCREWLGKKLDDAVFGEINAREGNGYVAYVHGILQDYPDAILFIEKRLWFSRVLGVDLGSAFGSGDALIYIPSLRKLMVIDLKTGAIEVEVEQNDQLMIYGFAAYSYFKMIGPIDVVEMVVYQRKPFTWSASPTVLKAYITSLREPAQRILAGAAFFLKNGYLHEKYYRPSPAACQWCPVVECPHHTKTLFKNKVPRQ
ncbi:MAG: protein of unknown function DUF2800 [Caudoviricetes sp.]|nr:MAG: protein of unknown function DUF2800 [Caudoviricetes sp.]